jgi:lysophospholipase
MPPFNLSLEADLIHRYSKDIQDFWQAQVTKGHFISADQIKIAYASAINPESEHTVVISSGRIEGLIKYKEVIFDLFNNGYSVFIHDHRGQGHSGRLLSNSHKGYVGTFDDYVEDFQQFMQLHVLPHTQQSGYSKPKLLCHSMGGAIGALYLLQYTSDFDDVVFSAPMFGIVAPLPELMTRAIINIGCALNRALKSEPWYFVGLGNYRSVDFKKNTLTNSAIRYGLFRQEYEAFPEVQLGGPTFHWLQQAVIAMNKIKDNAYKIENACLILQAGADSVVDNKQQKRVAHQMPNTDFMIIDQAKHELLLESDQFRLPSMNAVLKHFKTC